MSFLILFYILFSFVVNAAIGAYIAILLGYGPSSILAARQMITGMLNIREFNHVLVVAKERLGDLRNFDYLRKLLKRTKAENIDKPVKAAPAKVAVAELLKEVESADIQSFFEDAGDDEIEMMAPLQELFDDDIANVLMESGTEAWLMNEKNVETSILKLNTVMMKSGRLASSLDRQLRNCRGKATSFTLETCKNQLRDDCQSYLESQAQVTEEIQKNIDQFGELKYIAEDIEYSNMEQAAQVETTMSNLDRIASSDPEKGVADMIKELSKLRVARHSLRDQQERAFLTVARYEKRLETVSARMFYDETVGIRGRIGLEVAIASWWKQNRHQQRQLTFVLLDIAAFGPLNDEHGIFIGDAVLKCLGRSYEKTFDPQDVVAVYCGNCFLIATVNMGVRKTIAEIEKLRQALERTDFTYDKGSKRFTLQLTCAVTEALPKQTDTDVFRSVEKVLASAKKAGRNHTFYLDPKGLDPSTEKIDPPNFGADYVTVDLDEYTEN